MVPAPATRLGFKLFELALPGSKTGIFRKGFREGGQKLQVEKPLDDQARMRQLQKIQTEIKSFLEVLSAKTQLDELEEKAAARSEKILDFK